MQEVDLPPEIGNADEPSEQRRYSLLEADATAEAHVVTDAAWEAEAGCLGEAVADGLGQAVAHTMGQAVSDAAGEAVEDSASEAMADAA